MHGKYDITQIPKGNIPIGIAVLCALCVIGRLLPSLQ